MKQGEAGNGKRDVPPTHAPGRGPSGQNRHRPAKKAFSERARPKVQSGLSRLMFQSFARSRGLIPLLTKRGIFFPVESFRGTEIFADLAKTTSSNENVYKFILPHINGEQVQLYLRGTDTVSNCIDQVTRLNPKAEVKVLAADGAQYGRETNVDDLMKSPFQLLVSGDQWAIIPPKEVAETRTMITRPDLQQKPATILSRYAVLLISD